ncbi:hypothetical protein KBD87_03360 [Candidatus Saccharibacteria bacterium]|jgi:hypothetical protein|nr:hypothetical protein [Candidatus Saccharibacteria bacterium]
MENTVLDKAIDKFIGENGIYFELSMKNSDGQILSKYTSSIDASDVACYAGLMDEQLMKMVIDEGQDE